MIYDYIVVGSGPSGLTCAYYILQQSKTCLIIEREKTPGGCHRVDRIQGRFSEHGPRIYSNAYVNFLQLLRNNGIHNNFVNYNFSFLPSLNKKNKSSTFVQLIKVFSLTELFYLGRCYIDCLVDPNFYKQKSIYAIIKHFKKSSQEYVDKICRLTDGAGMQRYTAYQFFQLLNQFSLYAILEPTYPNDIGWVKQMVQMLLSKGAVLKLGSSVEALEKYEQDKYNLKTEDGHTYQGKHVIFATPTTTLENFFSNFNSISLAEYNKVSQYETYIPITLHWDTEILKLDAIWGQGIGPWNIAWIVMSDYMSDTTTKGTLISCCISKLNIKGTNNKTANECSENELIEEVLEQLEPLLLGKKPDISLLAPQVYYDNNEWKNRDTAYMSTPENYKIRFPFKMDNEHIYSVGTHNGLSTLHVTSAESAVQNSMHWANTYLHARQCIKSSWTLNQVLGIFIIVFITIIWSIYKLKYYLAL